MNLNININELKAKAKCLRQDGYFVEANLVDTLVNDLNAEQEKFIKAEITKDKFVENTRNFVIEAQQSKLAELRGLGKTLFCILNILHVCIICILYIYMYNNHTE